jgi:hypothetical protein
MKRRLDVIARHLIHERFNKAHHAEVVAGKTLGGSDHQLSRTGTFENGRHLARLLEAKNFGKR